MANPYSFLGRFQSAPKGPSSLVCAPLATLGSRLLTKEPRRPVIARASAFWTSWGHREAAGSQARLPRARVRTRARTDTPSGLFRVASPGPRPVAPGGPFRSSTDRLPTTGHGLRSDGLKGCPVGRSGSWFTRDLEYCASWPATTMDKTALCLLVRIDWEALGVRIEEVMARPFSETPSQPFRRRSRRGQLSYKPL